VEVDNLRLIGLKHMVDKCEGRGAVGTMLLGSIPLDISGCSSFQKNRCFCHICVKKLPINQSELYINRGLSVVMSEGFSRVLAVELGRLHLQDEAQAL